MQIEVFLKNNNKPFVVETDKDVDINKDDFVVVETKRGLELARVSRKVEGQATDFAFVRKATKYDKADDKTNDELGKNNLPKIQSIMNDMGFDVKVTLVEYTLDAKKMIIHFASENRIDFRELVKVLASEYKCKIEMHQIGFRDEVGLKGGLGICGRECCCKKFLTDFDKVGIKMAKNQNLSLNPAKITGLCGKLLCCLAYENDVYTELNQKMPKIHQHVFTPAGKGEVVYNDLFKERVYVRLDGDEYNLKDFNVSEIDFGENKWKD